MFIRVSQILKSIRVYIHTNKMLILPENSDIIYFSKENSERANNDSNNKIREKIIESMPHIDSDYFNDLEYGNSWFKIKSLFDEKMSELCPNFHNYKIQHRAGRNYNYDFEVSFYDSKKLLIKNSKLEFKFNASTVDNTPQFVSPMKPSQYLSNSFEDYYYNDYLVPLYKKFNLTVPDLDIYMKTIHNNKPKCVEDAKKLYDEGCKGSSKFTGSDEGLEFYKACNEASRECIKNFIKNTDLNTEKLNQYLIQSQDKKIYLLFKNDEFYLQYSNPEDYIIETYEKQPEKYRYIATTKSNKKVKILLRWKNGNGIAFPAFQIS